MPRCGSVAPARQHPDRRLRLGGRRRRRQPAPAPACRPPSTPPRAAEAAGYTPPPERGRASEILLGHGSAPRDRFGNGADRQCHRLETTTLKHALRSTRLPTLIARQLSRRLVSIALLTTTARGDGLSAECTLADACAAHWLKSEPPEPYDARRALHQGRPREVAAQPLPAALPAPHTQRPHPGAIIASAPPAIASQPRCRAFPANAAPAAPKP